MPKLEVSSHTQSLAGTQFIIILYGKKLTKKKQQENGRSTRPLLLLGAFNRDLCARAHNHIQMMNESDRRPLEKPRPTMQYFHCVYKPTGTRGTRCSSASGKCNRKTIMHRKYISIQVLTSKHWIFRRPNVVVVVFFQFLCRNDVAIFKCSKTKNHFCFSPQAFFFLILFLNIHILSRKLTLYYFI